MSNLIIYAIHILVAVWFGYADIHLLLTITNDDQWPSMDSYHHFQQLVVYLIVELP